MKFIPQAKKALLPEEFENAILYVNGADNAEEREKACPGILDQIKKSSSKAHHVLLKQKVFGKKIKVLPGMERKCN